jgi:hypothetical protein
MASILYGVINSNITTIEKSVSSSSAQKAGRCFFQKKLKVYEKKKSLGK